MIKIKIIKKKQEINSIKISGHAQSDEYGKDLVCAGVSAIAVGVCNTIAQKGYLDKKMCFIKMKNGNISIDIVKSDQTLQVILETLVISLETIKDSYGQYIQIINEEE